MNGEMKLVEYGIATCGGRLGVFLFGGGMGKKRVKKDREYQDGGWV